MRTSNRDNHWNNGSNVVFGVGVGARVHTATLDGGPVPEVDAGVAARNPLVFKGYGMMDPQDFRPGMITMVDNEYNARKLAELVADNDREQLVLVLTGGRKASIGIDDATEALRSPNRGLVITAYIGRPGDQHAFNDRLYELTRIDGLDVYNGFARIYVPSFKNDSDCWVFRPEDGRAIPRVLDRTITMMRPSCSALAYTSSTDAPMQSMRESFVTDPGAIPYGAMTEVPKPNGTGTYKAGTGPRLSDARNPGEAPVTGADTRLSLIKQRDALRGTVADLRSQVKRLRDARDDERAQIDFAKLAGTFASAEDWLDVAIRLEWASIIPNSSQSDQRLPNEWRYGDGFAESVKSFDYVGKAIEQMVWVLLGMSDGRGHPLYTNGNGSSKAVGEWGNIIHRVVVQTGPGGRRLHYTTDDEGRIVFLDISFHDDILRNQR